MLTYPPPFKKKINSFMPLPSSCSLKGLPFLLFNKFLTNWKDWFKPVNIIMCKDVFEYVDLRWYPWKAILKGQVI